MNHGAALEISMQWYSGTLGALLALMGCGGSTNRNGDASTQHGTTGGTTMGSGATGSTGGSSIADGLGVASVGGSSAGGSSSVGNPTGGDASEGGAPPQASCDEPGAPCGGDVVGEWSVVSSCLEVSGSVDVTGFGLGCASAPVTGFVEVIGTLIFGENGTLYDNTITTGTSEILLPSECAEVSVPRDWCDRMGTILTALGYASASCSEDSITYDCLCTAVFEQTGGPGPGVVNLDARTDGIYTTTDEVLVISDDAEYPHCVEGRFMTLAPRIVSKTGTLTGEIVLQSR